MLESSIDLNSLNVYFFEFGLVYLIRKFANLTALVSTNLEQCVASYSILTPVPRLLFSEGMYRNFLKP